MSLYLPDKTIYSIQSDLCITLKLKDSLKIDLVSVLDKRKGIGSRLVEHTLIKAAMEKVSSVEVTTETHNEAAINIYTRNGFREKARTSCLHFFHHDKQKSD